MNTYIILLRGVNVGGNNKVSMSELKDKLVQAGFNNVVTYINSGNVLLQSQKSSEHVEKEIELLLSQKFPLSSSVIKVLALELKRFKAIIENKPKGFGDKPETYHSDIIFLMNIEIHEALEVFTPKNGVDSIWSGEKVIYSQRLSSKLSKSNLDKIVGTKAYKSMTTRNWNTTNKLYQLAQTLAE